MTPGELYQARSQRQSLSKDPQQERAVKHLDRLAEALTRTEQPGFLSRMLGRRSAPTGIYLWGGVGAGKTMLMDIFYESLPFPEKKRTHFHHFMRAIHSHLKQQNQRSDPLRYVGRLIAGQCRVLCLDEFLVSDITDAMILSGLLRTLFESGLCLLTTSNTEPSELYRNGLQRDRFLPAIDLIKRNMHIVHLDNHVDYRLKTLQREGTYHYPLDERSLRQMESTFTTLSGCAAGSGELEINHRPIAFKGMAKGVAWFDFQSLCRSARSQDDYIDIAGRFHSLLLSDVRAMDGMADDSARRFLNLIDILYMHKVKLVISADSPVTELYRGRRLAAEFRRAVSRLFEMQSEEYLALPHSN